MSRHERQVQRVADQEFLASFAVEIDEAGVSRLQEVLEGNRALAEELAGAFSAATEAVHAFLEEIGALSVFSSSDPGVTEEGLGTSGLGVGLDLGEAEKQLAAFIELAKKPVPLSANASGIVSAGRSAYESVRSLFSNPITLTVNTQTKNDPGSDDPGSGITKMSVGGRFTKPTDVQVAEDGDAEYIIPVKKEDRALPLLRQLLGELSPAAREQLTGGAGTVDLSGLSAGNALAAQITQNNSNVSAPVNIHVQASGASAEEIGQSLYDTAERYLLRTLQSSIL